MGGMPGKVLALVITLALLGVVGVMTMLGANGSVVIYSITKSLADWSQLIALGVALGIFFFFLPKFKGKF